MKKTVAFSKNALNVFFHILTGCNLSCTHCYINPAQHGTAPLALDTVISWLKLFADKSRHANVIFLGGEPTLHPALSQSVKAARAMGYESITIDTNGYLFHNILSKVAPGEVDFFSFSLDGATRETNDRIRGRGSYDTCLKGIRNAGQKGFHTSLIYTVSRENLHEIHRMPELLAKLGLHRFFIQVIGIRGKSAAPESDRKCLQLLPEEWLGIIPEVADRVARLGITVTYPKVFLRPEEPFACAGIEAENYFLFPNGRVYRCPLCEDFPFHSHVIEKDRLVNTPKINEMDLFPLSIPEGCVMNKIIQPGNIEYTADGKPAYKIACCMLKEEIKSAAESS
ncbi:MAG: radical SAM protein [Desulfobacterales bacterium]|jgi:MoaA/NifB/PqqE/SkfB family radical SAM enzyme|nr:radical SAM protein [Desulfobacterales bacterium]